MKKLMILFWGLVISATLQPVAAQYTATCPSSDNTEATYTQQDKQIFQQYIAYISPWRSASIDTLLEKTALFFLDTPYVSHTLELPGEERLVVNLREFDCTTFVESVIALARTVRIVCTGNLEKTENFNNPENTKNLENIVNPENSENPNFDIFLNELRYIRYRNGDVKGYASRLHYTSDWLYDNEKKGVLKNISAAMGGIREEKTIGFMTAHRDAYRQLKDDDALLREIRHIENDINKRGGFYFLPKEKIPSGISSKPGVSGTSSKSNISGVSIKTGKSGASSNLNIHDALLIPDMSVAAFTTKIDGLDVTHIGFAYRAGGRLTFIHASSARGKVVIDKKTLGNYCAGQSSCTGVIVAQVL